MTIMLKKAFEEASKLSEMEQNVVAKMLIEEINSEKEWDKLFSNSEKLLEELAYEAIIEHENKMTKLIDSNL